MDPNSSAVEGSNVRRGTPIPDRRRRRLALLAGAAVAAGAVVAGVVVWQSRGGSPAPPQAVARPLSGRPPVVIQMPGAPVSASHPRAVLAAATKRLPAGDVRIAVARAMAGYSAATRESTLAALKRLPADKPVVAFNLGVAELWAGHPTPATLELKRVRVLDPYGYYGTNADNLLHPDEVRGYPPYVYPGPAPKGSPAELEAAARAHPSATRWLKAAVRLEGVDRVQAIADARRALALDPVGVGPQVAAAVLGYQKDNPMASITTLTQLAGNAPDNTEVRFHLGLLYFWIRSGGDAAAQMRLVRADAPHGPYATLAQVFEQCIPDPAHCASLAGG
ncbi:MAG TPA: hypothetical protein VFW18_06205 [Gaiellales bacterium]|nr:hypothetical protein [Gaiellales bacterium]